MFRKRFWATLIFVKMKNVFVRKTGRFSFPAGIEQSRVFILTTGILVFCLFFWKVQVLLFGFFFVCKKMLDLWQNLGKQINCVGEKVALNFSSCLYIKTEKKPWKYEKTTFEITNLLRNSRNAIKLFRRGKTTFASYCNLFRNL